MEAVTRASHPENSSGVASGGFQAVLEVAIPSQASRRQNAGERRDSDFDLAHGSGEHNLGSTEDTW